MDIRYSRSTIEVFYKGTRICSHERLHGRRGHILRWLAICP
ncbi:hypothetical protein [Robinsoniella sp. RHS]